MNRHVIPNSQIQNSDYDPFHIPADIELAKNHAKASRFAQPSIGQNDMCPCCGNQIELQELPICCDREEMNFNGAGIPLYFEFLFFCIIILIILGSISGSYGIIKNYNGKRCQESSTCESNMFNTYSLSNRDDQLDSVQSLLDLISTCVIILATIYYRRVMKETTAEIDDLNVSISDFSIQVSNLPRDTTEEELELFFSNCQPELEIRRICMGYDIMPYTKLIKEKELAESELSQLNKRDDSDAQPLINETKNSISLLNEKIQYLENQHPTALKFSGVAFITYNRSDQVKAICKLFTLTKLQLMFQKIIAIVQEDKRMFRGRNIYVIRAPEPGDIMWENLGVDPWLQWRHATITNITTLILLGGCFGIILGIQYAEKSFNGIYGVNDKQQLSVQVQLICLGLAGSMVISLLNLILEYYMKQLVKYEQPITQTEFNISYAYKLGMSQFLNTAIVMLIVKLIAVSDNYSYIERMWVESGLNQDVSFIFLINSIVIWLFNLIDPSYFYKQFEQTQLEDKSKICNQRQANTIFEGPAITLSNQYATVSKTLMLTFFYAELLPLGIMFSIGSLILMYYVEKYLFLRRYSRGPPVGSDLANEMIDFYIELAMTLYGVGNCIWQKLLYDEVSYFTFAQLGVALAQLIFPVDTMCGCLFTADEVETAQSYDQIKGNIFDDYMRRNPLTSTKAMDEWIKQTDRQLNERDKKNLMLQRLRQQNNKKREETSNHGIPQRNMIFLEPHNEQTVLNSSFHVSDSKSISPSNHNRLLQPKQIIGVQQQHLQLNKYPNSVNIQRKLITESSRNDHSLSSSQVLPLAQ